MHPYGGTPRCHRCNKPVYAAEQIMGPGRMLYHKPCLKCTSCNKRLDSLNLMEHDQEPYCKQCHVKLFGTVDLRHGNLPNRDEIIFTSPSRRARTGVPSSPPLSPTRLNGVANGTRKPSLSQVERNEDGVDESMDSLRLDEEPRVTVNTSARSRSRSRTRGLGVVDGESNVEGDSQQHAGDYSENLDEDIDNEPPRTRAFSPTSMSRSYTSPKLPTSDPISTSPSGSPLRSSTTGTRYGVALTGGNRPLSPLSTGSSGWSGRSLAMPGTGTPTCARCSKPVYFAEQAKAIGKTFHKLCLKCTECSTALDSTRLAERDGRVVCRSCYGKLYGPQGSGYALLGKAGG